MSTAGRELEFLDFFTSLELFPFITYDRRHNSGNILDNVLSNDELLCGHRVIDSVLSDHLLIILNFAASNSIHPNYTQEFSFSNHRNVLKFHDTWQQFKFTIYPSVENIAEFYSFLESNIESCFPHKRK